MAGATSQQSVVTVFGGSGFLGRHIVKRLASAGARVRVAVRHPAAFVASGLAPQEVSALCADVRDEIAVGRALEQAEAVVNSIGLYVERGDSTFAAVHVQGAFRIARQASLAGVGRLVHISGIGADRHSDSAYVRARAEGESRVQEAYPGATILRPSVLFGPGDAMFTTLAALSRYSPVLPLFGSGATRLQPVFVEDVAAAVAKTLADPSSRGRVYDLGGPRAYSYKELVELLLKRLGRKRVLLPVPFFAWEIQAGLLGLLPNPPLTRDQVALMQQDNVVEPGAKGFAELGIQPAALEEVLPAYIGPALP